MREEKNLFKIISEIDKLNDADRKKLVAYLNSDKRNQEPISKMEWVCIDSIRCNSYNPNTVATPEKRLLLRSMLNHGITCPLVVYSDSDSTYEIIDGYHRWSLIQKTKELKNRLNGLVPVVILKIPEEERIVATIRHNRARGKHQIDGIANVVQLLRTKGWEPNRIMEELGMEADEVLRLLQFKGLADLFKDSDYSNAWI